MTNLTAAQLDELWHCVSYALEKEQGRSVDAPSITQFSAKTFAEAVARHRLNLTLRPLLADLGFTSDEVAWIGQRDDRRRLGALAVARATVEVTNVLEEAAIPVLVMKGVALSIQTTGDIASRGCGDVDIWVAPENTQRAIAALESRGITRVPGYAPTDFSSLGFRYAKAILAELPMETSAGIPVDLHWWPLHVRGILPSFEQAWARRQVIDVAGTSVATLGVADALAHSCAHSQQDSWRWLRSIVDVARLARLIDPDVALPTKTVDPTADIAFRITRDPALARFGHESKQSARNVQVARRAQQRPVLEEPGRLTVESALVPVRARLSQSTRPANVVRALAVETFPPHRRGCARRRDGSVGNIG